MEGGFFFTCFASSDVIEFLLSLPSSSFVSLLLLLLLLLSDTSMTEVVAAAIAAASAADAWNFELLLLPFVAVDVLVDDDAAVDVCPPSLSIVVIFCFFEGGGG